MTASRMPLLKEFDIHVTSSSTPMVRVGFSNMFIVLSLVCLFFAFYLAPSVAIQFISIVALLFFFAAYVSSCSKISCDENVLWMETAFSSTKLNVCDIQKISCYEIPTSAFFIFRVKMRNGRNRIFHFTSPQTSEGSFTETVAILKSAFSG